MNENTRITSKVNRSGIENAQFSKGFLKFTSLDYNNNRRVTFVSCRNYNNIEAVDQITLNL